VEMEEDQTQVVPSQRLSRLRETSFVATPQYTHIFCWFSIVLKQVTYLGFMPYKRMMNVSQRRTHRYSAKRK